MTAHIIQLAKKNYYYGRNMINTVMGLMAKRKTTIFTE